MKGGGLLQIRYSRQALKFLNKQTVSAKIRIISAINQLPSGDVKKLRGRDGYRLRVGVYRVLFDTDWNVVYIEKIESRGQVYKK